MQFNLKAMFAGKREAIKRPSERGLGRSHKAMRKEMKKQEEEVEMPDVVLEALLHMEERPEAYYERLPVRRRRRTADCMDDEAWAVCHRLG